MTITNKIIKKYTFIDWTLMIPGSIIGGFVVTPGGLGMGNDWHIDADSFPKWKRICISESHINLKDKIPVTRISRTGVSIFHTNNKNLTELFFDFKMENENEKIKIPITFVFGEPVGLFLGNIIRSEGETLINILTCEGKDVWIYNA